MVELTTEEIARAYTRVLRGSQLTSDTAKAVLTMAARYLELRERIRVEAADAHKRGHLSLSAGLRVLLTPDAEEEPHHGE